MRNITKAFLITVLIYFTIISLIVMAYFLFPDDKSIKKSRVELSKMHFKKTSEDPLTHKKVKEQPHSFKKPKETAKNIKDPLKKNKEPKQMAQAQIDAILEKNKITPKRDPLVDSIYKKLPKSIESKTPLDPKEEMLKELYGGDYTLLSSKAKDYLKDNYEVMHAVTQNVLNRIGRVYIDPKFYYYDYNLIEFTLYPDGSISDIKMLKNAGFELLNKITKETIESAFKDYPPTDEPLLLRYKFLYDLRSF